MREKPEVGANYSLTDPAGVAGILFRTGKRDIYLKAPRSSSFFFLRTEV